MQIIIIKITRKVNAKTMINLVKCINLKMIDKFHNPNKILDNKWKN